MMLITVLSAISAMQSPEVNPAYLKSIVEKLASFQTRNTLSPTLNEAADWVAGEFKKMPGVEVELMEYTVPKGRRVPEPFKAVQVIATIKGESDRIILMGGHLDSLNLEVDAKTGRAPGANDDASGVAATMAVCKTLAGSKPKNTLKFVAFTGEEQGLLGASALAKRAQDEGWKIEAVLNNDTVGSSGNKSGQKDTNQVRVFSEEGESHQSREVARWIEWCVRDSMNDFRVKLVLRRDRFGRGGDHTPFVQAGFNGVRFIEVHEEFSRQHTPDDLPEFMDFDYLADVTRANLNCIRPLSMAMPAPTGVRIVRDQGHNTSLKWNSEPGVEYAVYWRDTASTVWERVQVVGVTDTVTIELVNKDDHFFAVGAIGGIPVAAQ